MTFPRRALACTLLLALAYLAAGALSTPTARIGHDTYRYAVTSLEMLGASPDGAHDRAVRAYCAGHAARSARAAERSPVGFRDARPEAAYLRECVQKHPDSLPPDDPRYVAIFEPRVGYPALAAPLVWLLGVVRGMWLASALCTAAAGAMVFALLRSTGAPSVYAAVGQVVLYLSPLGYWGGWALTTGPTVLCMTTALLGAWWMATRRVPLGAALTLAGLAAATLVKYSTGELVAAALCAGAVAALVFVPGARHRGAWLLAALSGACAAAVATVSHVAGWPGITRSLHEMFSGHFTESTVSDPWQRLAELNGNFWQHWTAEQLAQPVLLVALGVACWGLMRHSPRLAWLVLAVAATGIATQVLHPSAWQGTRLMAPVWITVAVGLPLALAHLPQWARHSPPPPPADTTRPLEPALSAH